MAEAKGLKSVWDQIVVPWVNPLLNAAQWTPTQVGSDPYVGKVTEDEKASKVSVEPVQRVCAGSVPKEVPSEPRVPEATTTKKLEDLIVSLDTESEPWQSMKYSKFSALWQGAAQRKRLHPRRTNKALGVCAVDLSGPHEATPRTGGHYKKNPCHYFLALTVRPDFTLSLIHI